MFLISTQHDASDLHTTWCFWSPHNMMLLISTQVDALQQVSHTQHDASDLHTTWCFWSPHSVMLLISTQVMSAWSVFQHQFHCIASHSRKHSTCNTLKQLWCKMLRNLLALHWAYLFPNLRQVTARQSFKIRPQSTLIQTLVVQLLVHLIFKQHVVPQGGVLDPRLLWNIGHRTLQSAIIFHDRIFSLLPM